MTDRYLEKLADVLVYYSLGEVDFKKEWKEGKKRLQIVYEHPADPLVKLVCERIWKMGGHVFAEMKPSWYSSNFYEYASDDVIRSKPAFEEKKLRYIAARLYILSEENTKAMAMADPKRRASYAKAVEKYGERAMEVDERGDFKIPWCVTAFPTNGYAQDMVMPLDKYTELVWDLMLLNEGDPVAAWKTIGKREQELIDGVLGGAKNIGIYSKDGTNLTMSVEGHKWIKSDGKRNFPSGEIFNAPRKDSVNGIVKFFELPQYDHGGPEVSGITVRFENGKVVEYQADAGQDYLKSFFEDNEGTKCLGEIALGDNPKVTKISKQILFDEKMGGTVHMAFGMAYSLHVIGDGDKSQLNKSVRHWDMIKDMRNEGSYVLVDDRYKLVWDSKAGYWTAEDLKTS